MYDPEQLPVFLGDTEPARPIRCIRFLVYSRRYLLPEDPDDFVVYSRWDWYVFVSPRDVFNRWDDDRVEIFILETALLRFLPCERFLLLPYNPMCQLLFFRPKKIP